MVGQLNVGHLAVFSQYLLSSSFLDEDRFEVLLRAFTVSHDTIFLENIATDVIHYEQRDVWGPYRKLVHCTFNTFKGKSGTVLREPC